MIQQENQCNEHIFSTQLSDLQYRVDVEDLFLDLKVLLKEYYMGTHDGKALMLNFSNGQKFKLSLCEV